MLLLLFVVQSCLWVHAEQVVQSAAAQGVQAASDLGGSLAEGRRTAAAFLQSDVSVVNPDVTIATMPRDEVQVQVRASAVSVFPFLHLAVGAVRRGSLQEFRSGE
jgi:hypothetical protein